MPARMLNEDRILGEALRRCYCEDCREQRAATRPYTPRETERRLGQIKRNKKAIRMSRQLDRYEENRETIQRKKEEEVYKAGLATRGPDVERD